MRSQYATRISLLIILLVFVLTACGGSANGSTSGVRADLTSMPSEGHTPKGMPIKSGDKQAVTSTRSATTIAQAAPANSNQNKTVTPTAPPLVIATVPNNEPIVRNTPAEPVPTAAPPQLPTDHPNFDADGDGFYTFAEFQKAVAALYPSYEWPDNYHVDPKTLLSGYAPYADQSRFEVGGEYSIIGMRHLCAWEMTWLDAYRDGNTSLMDKSLDQLQTVDLNNPMNDSSTRDYLKQMFQRAELGDPAMIQQYVDGNCKSMDFITPTPGSPVETASPGASA